LYNKEEKKTNVACVVERHSMYRYFVTNFKMYRTLTKQLGCPQQGPTFAAADVVSGGEQKSRRRELASSDFFDLCGLFHAALVAAIDPVLEQLFQSSCVVFIIIYQRKCIFGSTAGNRLDIEFAGLMRFLQTFPFPVEPATKPVLQFKLVRNVGHVLGELLVTLAN